MEGFKGPEACYDELDKETGASDLQKDLDDYGDKRKDGLKASMEAEMKDMENFEAEFLTNDDAFNAAFDLSNDTNDEIAALKLKNPSERPNGEELASIINERNPNIPDISGDEIAALKLIKEKNPDMGESELAGLLLKKPEINALGGEELASLFTKYRIDENGDKELRFPKDNEIGGEELASGEGALIKFIIDVVKEVSA